METVNAARRGPSTSISTLIALLPLYLVLLKTIIPDSVEGLTRVATKKTNPVVEAPVHFATTSGRRYGLRQHEIPASDWLSGRILPCYRLRP